MVAVFVRQHGGDGFDSATLVLEDEGFTDATLSASVSDISTCGITFVMHEEVGYPVTSAYLCFWLGPIFPGGPRGVYSIVHYKKVRL
jgi:hypothetical protein